ncbi:MAG: polysaccharide export protein [Pyrinomonadaceae bacterium]|nr:polysaccharide export protein [Pyrinomonadaceae bacterium]
MRVVKFIKNFGLILVGGLIFSTSAAAQEIVPPPTPEKIARQEPLKDSSEKIKTGETVKVTEPARETKTEPIADAPKTDIQTTEVKTDDKNLTSEEAAVISYYNNYLTDYRLGPNDVIAVEVFGQCPDYCKESITVPPTARISYPLVRGGIFVGGRTIEQIEDEITKKLDEYIIEPKVTVTLVKAMSARYSVMGKVTTPGIRVMDRKVSLSEAVAEAGGVLKEGNRKKIALVRFNAQGGLTRQDIDLAAIENGKAPVIYLAPGDQVFVPGKGFTVDTVFKALEKVSFVRLLLGSPF